MHELTESCLYLDAAEFSLGMEDSAHSNRAFQWRGTREKQRINGWTLAPETCPRALSVKRRSAMPYWCFATVESGEIVLGLSPSACRPELGTGCVAGALPVAPGCSRPFTASRPLERRERLARQSAVEPRRSIAHRPCASRPAGRIKLNPFRNCYQLPSAPESSKFRRLAVAFRGEGEYT
jgi:hypothetical protein